MTDNTQRPLRPGDRVRVVREQREDYGVFGVGVVPAGSIGVVGPHLDPDATCVEVWFSHYEDAPDWMIATTDLERISTYDSFKKYRMPAASVADFLTRYYKERRYTGRGDEYAASLLASYEREFEKRGFCFISHHDSKTGEIVAYYDPADPADLAHE